MLVDSHAHLDDSAYAEDLTAVIQRAKENGVSRIINIGADMDSSAKSLELSEKYEQIYAAVGIHPQDVVNAKAKDYDQLAAWLKLPKVVALGEIGLDYYYDDGAPRELQRKIFIEQIDVAKQMNKPIVVHNRDAHGDVMDILKKEAKGLTGVMHCYSGSWEMAKELIKMNFFLSVGGPVTFKNSAKLPEIVAKIPLEYLLLETDCPYLTPQPYRGKRNEPAYIKIIAEKIAQIRNITVEELAVATTDNVKNIFGIK